MVTTALTKPSSPVAHRLSDFLRFPPVLPCHQGLAAPRGDEVPGSCQRVRAGADCPHHVSACPAVLPYPVTCPTISVHVASPLYTGHLLAPQLSEANTEYLVLLTVLRSLNLHLSPFFCSPAIPPFFTPSPGLGHPQISSGPRGEGLNHPTPPVPVHPTPSRSHTGSMRTPHTISSRTSVIHVSSLACWSLQSCQYLKLAVASV
jgi:hypothetical protein